MTTIYVVRRDSADGLETDVFTDLAMAEEWCLACEGGLYEEQAIDRATLDAMLASRPPIDCGCCGGEHPAGYSGDCRNDEMRNQTDIQRCG